MLLVLVLCDTIHGLTPRVCATAALGLQAARSDVISERDRATAIAGQAAKDRQRAEAAAAQVQSLESQLNSARGSNRSLQQELEYAGVHGMLWWHLCSL